MADLADKAAELQAEAIAASLAEIAIPPANDITECVDCGVTISSERKQHMASAIRCFDCQTILENSRGGR